MATLYVAIRNIRMSSDMLPDVSWGCFGMFPGCFGGYFLDVLGMLSGCFGNVSLMIRECFLDDLGVFS